MADKEYIEPEDYTELITRMKKVEGQARGIQKMLEDQRSCEDILIQLAAMRAAINKVGMKLIGGYMGMCIEDELKKEGNTKDAVERTINTFLKFY